MKCHKCGGEMHEVTTDLPFKLGQHSIVIIKNLPVLQCGGCGEFIINDSVMKWIEETLEKVSPASELEIVRYAA
jgi:YgiT-type zinc finger domain-containing protein